MPTIYTFGDPELLREALLALATIFGLVEWGDPGSPLGLGGNMLAVALIGLVAIGIAGITSQQVRVDYLFVSLILFGIMFAVDTNVNVEDIQTGESAIVNDVPIGIAYVAAAASGAARSLTETTSTALQRPGSTTSLISEGGFMDPLRILLAMRSISFGDLAENVHKSLLEYYKICVGRTEVAEPGKFNLDKFRTVEDPIAHLFATANVLNFSVTYYSDANPDGVAQGCHAVAGQLEADIADLTAGAGDTMEAYLTRVLGSENYNSSHTLSDIEDAVDIIFRGSMAGQDFMARLMLRNFHNTGEAWRLAEYGSNQSQYVAQITEAFETQRQQSATEGSIFLQYMLPLMNFFQFLFFGIAPFIALVMIASPFTAAKVLGFYLLFGVWSYMWMPIAAVINHYMEISLQNALEFSGTDVLGSGYTALLGFDDFYNLAATKLVIGSNALAATPIIVGAILTGAAFGITNLAGRLGQPGRINTSVTSPSLAQNQALVSTGGRFSTAYGTPLSPSGQSGVFSTEKDAAYETVQFRQLAQAAKSTGESVLQSAKQSYEASVGRGIETLQRTFSEGGDASAFSQAFSSTSTQTIRNAIREGFGAQTAEDLADSQARELGAQWGLTTPVLGARESKNDTVVGRATIGELKKYTKDKAGEITAAVASSLSANRTIEQATGGAVSDVARSLSRAEEEYEAARSAQREASETARGLLEVSSGVDMDATEITARGIRRMGVGDAVATKDSIVNSFGTKGADWQREALQNYREKKPLGIDGTYDPVMSGKDSIASTLNVLAKEAARGDLDAASALTAITNAMAGIGDSRGISSYSRPYSGISSVDGRVDGVDERFNDVSDKIAENDPQASIDQVASEAQARIDAAGKDYPTIDESRIRAVEADARKRRQWANNDEELIRLYPGLYGGYESLRRKYGNIVAGAATETSFSGVLQDILKPGSGFNDVLENDLAPLAAADGSLVSTDRMADDAIGKLQGALIGQWAKRSDVDAIDQIYQKYQDMGFSKKQAVFATYGEIGRRTSGASDLFLAGLSAAVGSTIGEGLEERRQTRKPGFTGRLNRSALSVARIGGSATGVALFAAGVGLQKYTDGKKAEEAAKLLADDLKADFKKVNPEAYKEFAAEIDDRKTIEGVTEVLIEYYQTGKITDEQIDQFEPKQQFESTNTLAGFKVAKPKAANPFNDENFDK